MNYYYQYQQPQYMPMVYVNGIEGAKAYIVSPNQTVFLRDSDSNKLYEKTADSQGKYSMICYELKRIDTENKQNTLDTSKIATKEDLINLKNELLNIIQKTPQNENLGE